MEDLKDFNFIYKIGNTDTSTNIPHYRRLDRNNQKDKKIIRDAIRYLIKKSFNVPAPIANPPSSPLPEEVPPVARRPRTPESYTAQGNINIDPNKDIIWGKGLFNYAEKNSPAYKSFKDIINDYKDDYKNFPSYNSRKNIINQIKEDLKNYNFIHRIYCDTDTDTSTNIPHYRRLDKNNPKDKKIIRDTIRNHLTR
jgi:hypothetical protein